MVDRAHHRRQSVPLSEVRHLASDKRRGRRRRPKIASYSTNGVGGESMPFASEAEPPVHLRRIVRVSARPENRMEDSESIPNPA